jgi:hypothetical protein
MTFLRYKDTDFWWEVDYDQMRVYNYRGGWHYINENSEAYMEGVICEAESCRDLYLKKHYDPTETDMYHSKNAWISPEGTFHHGDAHSIMADHICDIWYGIDTYDDYQFGGENHLEKRGWIKVSATFWEMHIGEYYPLNPWIMNKKQYDALYDWCKWFKIEFPKDIIYVKETY